MANVEKMSVAVTQEMAAMMRRLIESGEYASASEVVREALRDWAHLRSQRDQAINDIRRHWDAGIESGTTGEGEDAFARIGAQPLSSRNG